jgi:long-chain acyl-CoA synthetase
MEGPGDGDWVLSMADLAKRGRDYLQSHPGAVRDKALATKPDNLATLIYTSGTTGRPKGVELLHRNWAYEGAAMEALHILRPDDVQLLWLPLAHSFGSVLLASQLQIGFVTAVDGRVDKIVENLSAVRPTIMASVPRIFEKVHAKVTGDVEHEGGAKAKIANWAFSVGRHVAEERAAGRRPNAGLMAQYRIADKLVFSKIKARMGGRIRYFVSGAAALSTEVNWWFQAAGMTILEGYGLTETSAATTVNRPGRVGIGTVGQPVPGTMVKIADDGEIMIKGPGTMRGYHNRPDLTAEVFTDGWFHTGDIGYVDNMGRVKITDRKKDLVKTSGGKYVAPSYIESRYKGITKIAMYMVVQAADRNYVTALIALDPDSLTAFAQQNGLSGDFSSLASLPAVAAQIEREVQQLNRGLNPWEQVKKYEILNRALTIEAGEITPSLKIRRAEISKNFGTLIDAMYT